MKKIPFPKAILFDKDGTLLDFDSYWIPVAYKAVEEILIRYAGETSKTEEIMLALGVENHKTDVHGILCGGTYGDIARCIGEILKGDGVAFQEDSLKADTIKAFETCLDKGKIKPACAQLKEVLCKLKGQGVTLILVTNDNRKVTEFCLRELEIADCFDEVIADGDGLPCKPNGKIIRHLAKKYGYEKERMLMVGDSLTDMKFAQNGGIFSLGVGEDRKRLEAIATVVTENVGYIFEVLS